MTMFLLLFRHVHQALCAVWNAIVVSGQYFWGRKRSREALNCCLNNAFFHAACKARLFALGHADSLRYLLFSLKTISRIYNIETYRQPVGQSGAKVGFGRRSTFIVDIKKAAEIN